MTEQIPAEAVEAAARADYRRHFRTGVPWEARSEGWRDYGRAIVRPIVEAAAPYLARVAPSERTIRIAARQAHPELDGLSIARHDAFVAGALWASSSQPTVEQAARGGGSGFPWEQATREPWPDDETKENDRG